MKEYASQTMPAQMVSGRTMDNDNISTLDLGVEQNAQRRSVGLQLELPFYNRYDPKIGTGSHNVEMHRFNVQEKKSITVIPPGVAYARGGSRRVI